MTKRDDLLLESAILFDKAENIERRANPNNEEDYAIATQKADRFIFDALFSMSMAIYGGKTNGGIN